MRTNNTDLEYNRLLNLVLSRGRRKKNRTGVDTLGVFGAQARFNLNEGFPLLTTKKVFFKGIVHELLWFIKGDTNIKYLVDNDVHIWDGNAYDAYLKRSSKLPQNAGKQPMTKEVFIDCIKSSSGAARQLGELGEGTYGGMWRGFPTAIVYNSEDKTTSGTYSKRVSYDMQRVDQLGKVIDKLKENPDDRRLIVSAWHPYWVDHCALPPCHVMFQFHTEELTTEERISEGVGANWKQYAFGDYPTNYESWKTESEMDRLGIPRRRLNCQLYQRSCDLFLGVPFNIASYALLTHLVAHSVGMVAGDFIHSFGDLHIYENHLDQVREQLRREPRALPKLVLNPDKKDLFAFHYEDIKVEGYDPHPAIKAEMAV